MSFRITRQEWGKLKLILLGIFSTLMAIPIRDWIIEIVGHDGMYVFGAGLLGFFAVVYFIDF